MADNLDPDGVELPRKGLCGAIAELWRGLPPRFISSRRSSADAIESSPPGTCRADAAVRDVVSPCVPSRPPPWLSLGLGDGQFETGCATTGALTVKSAEMGASLLNRSSRSRGTTLWNAAAAAARSSCGVCARDRGELLAGETGVRATAGVNARGELGVKDVGEGGGGARLSRSGDGGGDSSDRPPMRGPSRPGVCACRLPSAMADAVLSGGTTRSGSTGAGERTMCGTGSGLETGEGGGVSCGHISLRST